MKRTPKWKKILEANRADEAQRAHNRRFLPSGVSSFKKIRTKPLHRWQNRGNSSN